jgi:hypothetical protein
VTPATTEELRDRLTRLHLMSAGEAAEATDVRNFRRNWWDGAARVPAVVVRLGVGGRASRCRLVENGGQVIALPAVGWRARRAIRRLRRRAAVDPRLLALARRTPDVRVDDTRPVSVVRQRSYLPDQQKMSRRTADPPKLAVRIEQEADVVRCRGANCAALVPIPPPGRLLNDAACPRCGRVELPAQQVSPATTEPSLLS